MGVITSDIIIMSNSNRTRSQNTMNSNRPLSLSKVELLDKNWKQIDASEKKIHTEIAGDKYLKFLDNVEEQGHQNGSVFQRFFKRRDHNSTKKMFKCSVNHTQTADF